MKKILLFLALIIGLGTVNAQVLTQTSEGLGYNFGTLITYGGVKKAKTSLLTDSTAVPLYEVLYLKTTKAVNTVLPAGTVSGQQLTITMVTDGGNYNLIPTNLFIGDTILFDDAGDYWQGIWRDTTWITLSKTATIK